MPSPTIPHFLVHSPKDNVGVVVVEGLAGGNEDERRHHRDGYADHRQGQS